MPASKKAQYDADGFDAEGYNSDGFNALGYNREGYDAEGYDETGYDSDCYNRDGFDPEGYNRDGFDVDGYNRDGYDSDGYDSDGYNEEGYDSDGYNREGFDCDGIHNETGTEYNEDGYNQYGEYHEASESESFAECLMQYRADVIEECGWHPPANHWPMLLAGHEIEMYSNDTDFGDVEYTLTQLNIAYRLHKPSTRGGPSTARCCIAKHDGSLSDGGFETVTVPLTAEQTYGMFGSISVLGDGRCSAWRHGCEVGHHIHVSRAAITPLTQGKLGVFLNLPHNRKFVEAIAQRAAHYNGFENNKRLTRPRPIIRHSVMNVTAHTVEFRLFKSNLRCTGILKNYEFAISSIRFCQFASHSDLNYERYLSWLSDNRKQYRYMHNFLMSGIASAFSAQYRLLVPRNVAHNKNNESVPQPANV